MSRILPPQGTLSSLASSSRPIAPLPNYQQQQQQQQQHQNQQAQHNQQTKWTPYRPETWELHPGPKNRLFLALKSSIEEEVDWALPRLVVASFDDSQTQNTSSEKFRLETWVDSVSALIEWPIKWLDQLELESTSVLLRERRYPFEGSDLDSDLGADLDSVGEKRKRQAQPQQHEVDSKTKAKTKTKTKTKAQIDLAKSVIPEWTIDKRKLEERATNSLLILRNSSFTTSNSKIICRTIFLDFLLRFFNLPIDFLINHLMLNSPEPIHHILIIIQSIFPYLRISPHHFSTSMSTSISNSNSNSRANGQAQAHAHAHDEIKTVFGDILPRLLIQTKDQSMINNLIPLIIMGLTIPNCLSQSIESELIEHLLRSLVLRPSSSSSSSTTTTSSSSSNTITSLDLSLDLLISLTQNPIYARQILSNKDFVFHLKNLVMLLEYGSKSIGLSWDNPDPQSTGKVYRNPASNFIRLESVAKRRIQEREIAQRQMEIFGGQGVKVDVGEKPPVLSQITRERLYNMREPNRSISWMHEAFVYSSTSQLLQVTFWHAYRDFFQNPSTIEPLLSAAEVIKNVTIAFPGAMAKVWTDEMGGQKFVIAGIGFRKTSDDQERFSCLWKDCNSRHGSINSSSLLSHLQSHHLSSTTQPLQCQWATCTHTPFTLSHLLTHLPLVQAVPVLEVVTVYPTTPEYALSQSIITNRSVPPLAKPFKLHCVAQTTPIDSKRHPVGVAFLTSLILRNLSRTLRTELSLLNVDNDDGENGNDNTEGKNKRDKKKNLLEERFGLPIPDNVLKEEEEEEEANNNANAAGRREKELNEQLAKKEMERAKFAFISVQDRLEEVTEKNMSGLATYLGDSLGWF
ncbi:uncharacterized protein IL334_003811 [Kwoniella shivajii]|uniref:RFX-type winged-helix domain-containing protein n=1 Tax=Kwoniella shivajii TaxID=564305 RepID=A0ABZ1CYK9_9TREE|nr:hypothetical protein IL334_003811 [Kwoniella shivajii]